MSEVDLLLLGIDNEAQRAKCQGHWCLMTRAEVDKFTIATALPTVTVFNALRLNLRIFECMAVESTQQTVWRVQCHLPGALSTAGLPVGCSAADRGAAYERPCVVRPVQPDDKHGAAPQKRAGHDRVGDAIAAGAEGQGLAAAQSLEGALPRVAALVVLHA